MTYYRRRSLEWWEELAAVGAGVLVGAAGAYLARQWLRRSVAGPGRRRSPSAPDRTGPPEEGRDPGS